VPSLSAVFALQHMADDVFRAPPVPTVLDRTFGGQVVGQTFAAAILTAPEPMRPHSLHGYFLRPGRPGLPMELQVERLRDGASFAARHVTASQDGETIFSLTASFQATEAGPEHQASMPAVADPDGTAGFVPPPGPLERVMRGDWPDWDFRIVAADDPRAPRRQYWMRHRDPLPDDPGLHACALVYLSDLALVGTAGSPQSGPPSMVASLDHAVWLLRPFRVDEWLLYDQFSPSAGSGRGLVQGRFFDLGGRLVAVVTQEGVLRWRADPSARRLDGLRPNASPSSPAEEPTNGRLRQRSRT
jgi:acyl-CoA thioesterase-2